MGISIRSGTGYVLPGGSATAPMVLTLGGTANTSAPVGVLRNYAVTVVDGTPPYTYAWVLYDSTGADRTALMSAPLAASGTYTPDFAPGGWTEGVTVTDSTGATATAFRELTQPGTRLLSLTLSTTSGSTMTSLVQRSYGVTVSGGSTPYTYAWALYDAYGTNAAASLMSAPTGASGTYTPYWAPGIWIEAVTVTDAVGTTGTVYRPIVQDNVMSYSIYADWTPTGTENPPAAPPANTVVVV